MKKVFADTFFWIALANPRDESHKAAKEAQQQLANSRLYTNDEVLVEFLTFFSRLGADMRQVAVKLVQRIMTNPNITVTAQTRESFKLGLRLYEMRSDKEYSMTDCISMETMRVQELNDVLTGDEHFAQDGFNVLL